MTKTLITSKMRLVGLVVLKCRLSLKRILQKYFPNMHAVVCLFDFTRDWHFWAFSSGGECPHYNSLCPSHKSCALHQLHCSSLDMHQHLNAFLMQQLIASYVPGQMEFWSISECQLTKMFISTQLEEMKGKLLRTLLKVLIKYITCCKKYLSRQYVGLLRLSVLSTFSNTYSN